MKQKEYLELIDSVIQQGPYQDTWESLSGYQVPQWYQKAKFGIFIHYGVFCVPAYGSEWYAYAMYHKEMSDGGKNIYEYHRKHYGDHAVFGYKDFIPMFRAENFNADEWVSLFKQAGAKYMIPVAEHHDGFQLYDSDLSDWNSVKMGPRRDILGELKQAAQAQGLIFAASSHRAEHWWFMCGGMTFECDVSSGKYADLYGPAKPYDKSGILDFEHPTEPDEDFLKDWLARTCELVDRYRPRVVYFDWWIEQPAFKPYLKKFAAYYYNRAAEWGEEVVINYKHDAFLLGTAVYDVERGQLTDIRPDKWQTDTSMTTNAWCYTQDNQYKDACTLICDMIDVVSKNGNMLLNVGPKADGTIPDEDRNILLEIGRWMQANGEGIYGTRYWKVYGEGTAEVVEGPHSEHLRKAYTSEDIRYTMKNDTLYAFHLKPSENRTVLLKSLAKCGRLFRGAVLDVTMLENGAAPTWQWDENGLFVDYSACGVDCGHPVCMKIRLD